jgi:hypothetical protein
LQALSGQGYKVFKKPVMTVQTMEKHGITDKKGMTSFMFCSCRKGWAMEEQFKLGKLEIGLSSP